MRRRITIDHLYKGYLEWPEKISEALRTQPKNCQERDERGEGLLIAGIGGSGAPGRILESLSIVRGSPPHVWSISSANLDPRISSKNIPAVCVSYSGTTLETIKILEDLLSMKRLVGVVTSDGPMLKIAERESLPVFMLNQGSLPRVELPSMLVGIDKISRCVGASLNIERDLVEARDILGRERRSIEDLGLEIASKIGEASSHGKRISIAATRPYYPIIHRIRSELSENAAIPSEPLEMPETGHNQIASLRSGRGSLVIHIVDQDLGEDLALRGYFKKLSEKYPEIEILEINPPGDTGYLLKTLYIAMVFGIASAALGKERNIDPEYIDEMRLFRDHMYGYYSSLLRRFISSF
ncbi:MAG TPA: SIS domain-containing protein [Sulfolobales archaeon]|nr:SIS domain-containing protein [Sulfolobales archaeon]